MAMHGQERTLLSIPQVAERLAVSIPTVRRLVQRGELPALRVGGSLRVDSDELGRWLYDVRLEGRRSR
jgi:excisionase family DNA binding protein